MRDTADAGVRVTRLREKQVSDRTRLDALLDEARVAHVAVVRDDGTPLVLPVAMARDGDRLLLHGSTGSPWLRRIAAGGDVCVAVTEVDGLVFARSAFESSMHYRSAVLFGRCGVLSGDDKRQALDVLTDALLNARASEVRASTVKELAATVVLALPIQEWSLKVSDGWPEDLPEDISGPAWAGVVPLHTVAGEPWPAPDLRAGITVPASVSSLS